LKFTAFGFLSFDYCLLFAIFWGVTTYLVVAIQYDNRDLQTSCRSTSASKSHLHVLWRFTKETDTDEGRW
jgi:hypothetical protein